MKNAGHTQHTEYYKSGKEKYRNDCKEIHNSIKRHQETESRTPPAFVRIQIFSRPYTKNIFHTKNKYGNVFHTFKYSCQKCQLIKRLQKSHQYIGNDCHRNENVKHPADWIAFVTYLYNIKYFLF